MPRLSLPLLCFGIILVQLDEGRFITKARPKKYDCSEIEKYSRENALQTSGKSVEGEVANWWKGQMPLCSRTQWSFESLADQNSEFLCWRFQFCAQLTPSNEKYWQKGTRKFYSQAIWPSFSRRGSGNLTRLNHENNQCLLSNVSKRWPSALGTTSDTHPSAENIENAPAMLQIGTMLTFAGKQNVNTLVVETR